VFSLWQMHPAPLWLLLRQRNMHGNTKKTITFTMSAAQEADVQNG